MNNQRQYFLFLIGWFWGLNLGDWISTAYNLYLWKIEINYFYNLLWLNIYSFGLFKTLVCVIYMIIFNLIFLWFEEKDEKFLKYYNLYLFFINCYFAFLIGHNMNLTVFRW